MSALCAQIRPGGLLVMDHYTHGYPRGWSRRLWRAMLLRAPAPAPLRICETMTAVLWPLHEALWSHRSALSPVRQMFLRLSPIVDYHDAYPQLDPATMKSWATLDTHDTLTDRFKHLRTAGQIRDWLRSCGMEPVETFAAGNGIEARATRSPASR